MAKEKIQHTGIMNKMRDKMPLIIIILIIAFLATIVFEWGMNYMGMGGQTDAFGKINSNEITYKEFERIVQQQIEQTRQNNNEAEVDEATIKSIRDNVWNSLVSQSITQQAIEDYGIKVSDKEILDWINRPETLPEPIKRNFMDSTGVFNVAYYQQALNMKNQEATQFWTQVENYLRETLLSEKLQAILTEGAVISEADVLEKYTDDNINANFDYVLLDLNTLTDTSQFAVNDEDLKKYYDEHKSDFKQDESVMLKYIDFKEVSTAEDSAFVMKQIEGLKNEFKTVQEADSALIKFVNENSTVKWNPEFVKPSDFDKAGIAFLNSAKPGDVSDVSITTTGYKLIKLLDTKESADLYVNASHILINFEGKDTAEAKRLAQDAFNKVKNGGDINELAYELSEDPSAKQNKGDLGWFKKGAMVKEFEEAAFSGNIGDVVGPVKTSFGFHVLKIQGKSNKEYKVAQIVKDVKPSSRSKDIVRKKAEDLYAELEKGQNIDSLAKKINLQASNTPFIKKDDPIPGLGVNKKITNFIFENKVNSNSEPVKTQTGWAVYKIIDKIPEGYQSFDSIKVTLVKPKLINEKKFQILLGKANELEGKIVNGDLNSIRNDASQYSFATADSFKVSKPNAQIGQDYALSRAIFKMKPGEISKPIKGAKGYYIVKLNSVTEFSEEDYLLKAPDIKKSLLSTKRQSIVSDWLTKMQNNAEIIDNRDKYF